MKEYKAVVTCTITFDLDIEANSNEQAELKAKHILEKKAAWDYVDLDPIDNMVNSETIDQRIEDVTIHEQSLIQNYEKERIG